MFSEFVEGLFSQIIASGPYDEVDAIFIILFGFTLVIATSIAITYGISKVIIHYWKFYRKGYSRKTMAFRK